jgi:hypothetical protein
MDGRRVIGVALQKQISLRLSIQLMSTVNLFLMVTTQYGQILSPMRIRVFFVSQGGSYFTNNQGGFFETGTGIQRRWQRVI